MNKLEAKVTRRELLLASLGLTTALGVCGDPEDPVLEGNKQANLSQRMLEPGITDASKSDELRLEQTSPQHNEVDAAKETQANGLQVIDNLGIRVGDKIFDVFVDQEKLKDLIRLIASVLLEEKYLAEVEILLNKLIISFGSRSYHETVNFALKRRDESAEDPKSSWKVKFLVFLDSISKFIQEPRGFSVSDANYPFIGINTSKIIGTNVNLQDVITHEIGHFVCLANPELKESTLESAIELTLIHFGLLSTLSVGISSLSLASSTGWDMKRLRSYFAQRKELLKSNIFRTAAIEFIPAKLLADHIHYTFFDDDEIIARRAVDKTKIDPDEFAKIIRVVERQEIR